MIYIANKGANQTKIYNNPDNYKMNDIKWDANYDGKVADIKLDINNNGEKKNVHFNLNNEDLAELLNVPSVGEDLQKRLKNDFKWNSSKQPNFLELNKETEPKEDIDIFHNKVIKKYNTTPKTYYKKYQNKFSVKRNKRYKPKTMRVYNNNKRSTV